MICTMCDLPVVGEFCECEETEEAWCHSVGRAGRYHVSGQLVDLKAGQTLSFDSEAARNSAGVELVIEARRHLTPTARCPWCYRAPLR